MKVLILGSSGWVAHYLIAELLKSGHQVQGVSATNSPQHTISNEHIQITDTMAYLKLIENFCPDTVVNMLHGNDYENSYRLHLALITNILSLNTHYIFLSSSNALDGDSLRPHEEFHKAIGASEYGKYKARCEQAMEESFGHSTIIRFPAIHGFAPNRLARTEQFLKKLQDGETVVVNRKIYQNRPFVGHLAKMIAGIIYKKISGIFHLGTTDQSEEFVFLRKLAQEFGHPEERVTPGPENESYLTVWSKRILEIFGSQFDFTENDTLKALSECPHLQKFRV